MAPSDVESVRGQRRWVAGRWAASLIVGLAIVAPLRGAEKVRGLLLEYKMDEGSERVAKDTSGNGLDGKIVGAGYVAQGAGHVLTFDGSGHVMVPANEALRDLGKPGGSYTVEVWFKSAGKHDQSMTEKWPGGAPYPWAIRGPGKDGTIAFALYDPASGGNPVVRTGEAGLCDGWHHLVAVRDARANQLRVYLDGMFAGAAADDLRATDVSNAGPIYIAARTAGSKGRFGFRGQLDGFRLYGRALTAGEAADGYKQAAGEYGIDTAWFHRLKLTPYHYPDREAFVVQLHYGGLMPLPRDAVLLVELASAKAADAGAIRTRRIKASNVAGLSEVTFSLSDLGPGKYRVQAAFVQEGVCPVEKLEFDHPAPAASVVSPAERIAPALPTPPGAATFAVDVTDGGGFTITLAGERFPFESWFSYPNAEYNTLICGDKSPYKSEEAWSPKARKVSDTEFEVRASGKYYALTRRILIRDDHVKIEDAFVNTTDEDLGILIWNHLDSTHSGFGRHFTGGYEEMGRKDEEACPTVFAAKEGVGFGLLPLDDVSIVQSVLYTEPTCVGVGTEKFALGPKKAYTVEWAGDPNTTGDYYDFINAVRRSEDRVGTIDGGFAFISKGPYDRRQVPTKEFVDLRNIKYGAIHCLSGAADDPEVSIEGIEFMDFPEEKALLKKQMADVHERFPDLKVFFHVAHSLYLTNDPERFADSKVIKADGTQSVWGDEGFRYITKQRQDEGWQWYIYYPMPGNSFHDAMLKSVDVMMDELGADGAFMDGYFWGYRGRWTYDRWDGHSAEIDSKTKTIKRKMASVLLLSQPSLIEFSRKIRDKGGVVVANNTVLTRTIVREKYLIHDKEVHSGPYLHLAPSCTALANPGKIRNERDIYLDALDKLRWGMLFFYYEEGEVSHRSLPSRMFPMTFEEIRPGLVRGPERIVTSRSGVYGWPGSRDLHAVYFYDDRGGEASHGFVTTAADGEVRTDVKLGENESAVVERVPLSVEADAPVNLIVRRYDAGAIELALNGRGAVRLAARSGAFAIEPGAGYAVLTDGPKEVRAGDDGVLTVEVALDGPATVRIEPAGQSD